MLSGPSANMENMVPRSHSGEGDTRDNRDINSPPPPDPNLMTPSSIFFRMWSDSFTSPAPLVARGYTNAQVHLSVLRTRHGFNLRVLAVLASTAPESALKVVQCTALAHAHFRWAIEQHACASSIQRLFRSFSNRQDCKLAEAATTI